MLHATLLLRTGQPVPLSTGTTRKKPKSPTYESSTELTVLALGQSLLLFDPKQFLLWSQSLWAVLHYLPLFFPQDLFLLVRYPLTQALSSMKFLSSGLCNQKASTACSSLCACCCLIWAHPGLLSSQNPTLHIPPKGGQLCSIRPCPWDFSPAAR